MTVQRVEMPAVFVSDFGPLPALENDDYARALVQLGHDFPKPNAVVIVSGHWTSRDKVQVHASARPGIQYDYAGFPKEFYGLRYDCAGHPVLAEIIVKRLISAGIPAETELRRPLDHGAWVPLSRIYPKADVPVVALSLPDDNPVKTCSIGRALASLRRDGVLLLASGALSHNLKLAFQHSKLDPPDDWVVEFDRWLKECLTQNPDRLNEYRRQAPHASKAAPTAEHFDPVFFILGARNREEAVVYRHESIRFGNGLMKILGYGLE